MRSTSIFASLILLAISGFNLSIASPPQHTLSRPSIFQDANISLPLFAELEELARIVDISYCVGTTGISKPFQCASRCNDFPNFELVTTFNTGPLMSDSCGYVALDHGKKTSGSGGIHQGKGRIIVAFRGTYSIANTIVDLSTVPQEYVPYPEEPGNSTTNPDGGDVGRQRPPFWDRIPKPGFLSARRRSVRQSESLQAQKASPTARIRGDQSRKCENCTVHSGFWTSWQNTRSVILPHLYLMKQNHPDYDLHFVGHSLGGAVAALAGLEANGLGWKPTITTFGEPRVGNAPFRDYIDSIFALNSKSNDGNGERYRRVTHVDDPVPLLPLQEWGYRAHAGEVYISKAALSPMRADVRLCFGDEDVNCIASAEVDEAWFESVDKDIDIDLLEEIGQAAIAEVQDEPIEARQLGKRWGVPIPARYKMWQLFFAHRDYFWRLGLCVAGGDPWDWGRGQYNFTDIDVELPRGKEVEEL
ncbi:hypothetical protein BP6252_05128 [Coleophoma cylindrospora]|uniref:Fungal lipase-type domain-containing protein n=1 Tax=Coleophoma cylindrospora TaxID=1849047 RepID=A0A3D8RSV1_9HELO|nr:hypothetical protein BP6252_05128 [Coleophoma cylindrospora]